MVGTMVMIVIFGTGTIKMKVIPSRTPQKPMGIRIVL
jgi:hypothetical protein